MLYKEHEPAHFKRPWTYTISNLFNVFIFRGKTTCSTKDVGTLRKASMCNERKLIKNVSWYQEDRPYIKCKGNWRWSSGKKQLNAVFFNRGKDAATRTQLWMIYPWEIIYRVQDFFQLNDIIKSNYDNRLNIWLRLM